MGVDAEVFINLGDDASASDNDEIGERRGVVAQGIEMAKMTLLIALTEGDLPPLDPNL